MQYVAALELEAVLDQALESTESRSAGTKTPGLNAFVTPVTPGPGRTIATPLKTPGSSSMIRYAETPASLKREAAYEEVAVGTIDDQETTPPETLAKLEKARNLKKAFDTWIIPRWKALVAARQEERARVRPSELERFEPGR
jgi:Fanconi-associated nuclease 1